MDVANPAAPKVVGEFGEPAEGEATHELRVWPQESLLIVMYFPCRVIDHLCAPEAVTSRIGFFDLANPAAPKLVATYRPSHVPHEMFLWVGAGRALLYLSTNTRVPPSMIVTDVSRAREGVFEETFKLETGRLHSMSVSDDGRRAYLAHVEGGLAVLDTRGFRQLSRLTGWKPGPHSAVKVPGKPLLVTTDEVYRRPPWGSLRLIDISNEFRPRVAAEYSLEEPGGNFSSHNPTVLDDVAFVSWHSGGLQAISIDGEPAQVGAFRPDPLPGVATEDPVLGSGVAIWSYPVIRNGLIYVTDVRNGFYILHHPKVEGIAFKEGNSNLGSVTQAAPVQPLAPELPPHEPPLTPSGVAGLAFLAAIVLWIAWNRTR